MTGMSAEEKIIFESKKRFERCEEWEQKARETFLFDMKFTNGDSSNLWQWPDEVSGPRNQTNRPCLTINKTKQHCLQVINSQRQNQSQVEVRPVGNGASYEAAKVFEGLVRHIEYQSQASQAYSNACYSQVIGGIGYWRIITDYAHDDSFDQEIFIRRVADPLSVFLDPDIQEADGSDAKFAFVFKDMPREDFEAEYPDEADIGNAAPFSESNGYDPWNTKDHVRVCEYFCRSTRSDRLHVMDTGHTLRESTVKTAYPNNPGLLKTLKDSSVLVRDIETPHIDWYLIAGSKVIDQKEYVGKYIPIVRCVGEEIVIDKQLSRFGHARALIDSQRIYNYWSSSAVEFVALQSKTPYVVADEAIEGHEDEWAVANIENRAYLSYNSMDENGNALPKPERAPPPMMSQAYLDGLKLAATEMMMVTGQYEANMGQKSNEVSGTAVDARQRQGDNATYHYIDRFSQAIRYTGRILIDLIPKIYDSERVVKILAENGDQSTVKIDPNAPQAHQQLQNPEAPDFDPSAIQAIFNPLVGQYSVEADIGPAYSTRRQETFHAISQMLQQNESLAPVIGDLLFKAADFPMADEIAERLHNMVPKQALGGAPDPQIAQLQQMLAQQHQVMDKMNQELTDAKAKAGDNSAKNDIEVYRAETDRMKAVGGIDPEAMMPIVRQMVSQVLGVPANQVIKMHMQEHADMPQRPAAPPSPVLAPQAPDQP